MALSQTDMVAADLPQSCQHLLKRRTSPHGDRLDMTSTDPGTSKSTIDYIMSPSTDIVAQADVVNPVLLHTRYTAEEFEAHITAQIVITSSKASSNSLQKQLGPPEKMQKTILNTVASNEDEAMVQMGPDNWIGKLLGQSPSHIALERPFRC